MRPALTTALAPLVALPLVASPARAQQSPSPTPSQSSPAPAPTATPHADRVCAHVTELTAQGSSKVGGLTTITATRAGGDPDQPATVRLSRVTPAPSAVVRQESSTQTVTTWTVRLGETHRFTADASQSNGQCFPTGRPQPALTVEITPELTIAARRNSTRDYTFSGRVLPGRGQKVSLFRTEGSRHVLTSQTTVRPDGTYSIDRVFTGSGRFGFFVAVGRSDTNAAGSSSIRPTVIH